MIVKEINNDGNLKLLTNHNMFVNIIFKYYSLKYKLFRISNNSETE